MRHLMSSFVRTLTIAGLFALPMIISDPAYSGTGAISTNDKDDYQGDRVSFSFNVGTYRERKDDPVVRDDRLSPSCQKAYIPAGVTLVGVGRETLKDLDNTDADYEVFTIACKESYASLELTITNCSSYKHFLRDCDGELLWLPSSSDPNKGSFRRGQTLKLKVDTLTTFKPNRYGLAYGALAVPFKYQLTGKKEFQGSATVGPYVGYRFDRQGWAGYGLTVMAFAGAANVKGEETEKKTNTTTDANGDTTTTVSKDEDSTNLAAFSYGFGLLGTVKGGFQLGAVLGFDHADSGKGFKYNDKPWLAVQIGYEFSLPN